jgi:hypothetical protein
MLTLREEHRLRVFENRVLRRIFGLKREEVIGGWRRLYHLYASPNVLRTIKMKEGQMGGLCRTHGTDKKCTQGFWSVNLKGKDYTEDLDSWKDIGMDLREIW